jgi:hypothetical protein
MDDLVPPSFPFRFYELRSDDERIVLSVSPTEVESVRAHFEEHPITLDDGAVVPVDVLGRAGDSWIAEPTAGPSSAPQPLTLDDLVGLDVREAAQHATEAGWLVRAHEPEAVLTADYRTNRVNLCYAPDGRVSRADIG